MGLYSSLGSSYYNLGHIAVNLEKKESAIKNYTKAAEIFEDIYDKYQIEKYKGWEKLANNEIAKLKK